MIVTTGPSDQLQRWVAEGGDQQIAVRELLAVWGAKRRSFQAVDQINRDLRRHGLRVDPPIIDVPIDDEVTLSSASTSTPVPAADPSELNDWTSTPDLFLEEVAAVIPIDFVAPPLVDAEVRMKVSWIPSAKSPVERVSPDADLVLAQAKMLRYDYSQLAVQSGARSDPLAISWESIAKARIKNRDATIKDATEPAESVNWNDDLVPLIPKIIDNGYVFVRGRDRSLAGIVTTADLSKQFEEFAKPFLLLGEIERGLRVVLEDTFSLETLASIRDDRDPTRIVESAADLTMGEMRRLLESQSNFAQLGWVMDRKEFIAAMREVNELRNEIMHFSPDAVSDDELRILRNFQQMLQKLAPQL